MKRVKTSRRKNFFDRMDGQIKERDGKIKLLGEEIKKIEEQAKQRIKDLERMKIAIRILCSDMIIYHAKELIGKTVVLTTPFGHPICDKQIARKKIKVKGISDDNLCRPEIVKTSDRGIICARDFEQNYLFTIIPVTDTKNGVKKYTEFYIYDDKTKTQEFEILD